MCMISTSSILVSMAPSLYFIALADWSLPQSKSVALTGEKEYPFGFRFFCFFAFLNPPADGGK